MGKHRTAKRLSVLLATAVIFVCFTMPASAYTLNNDFTLYTLIGVENAPVNTPLPVETKDGIQIANKAQIFENKNAGITMKNKVKIDGLEIIYRLDSWDGDKNDFPAFCIGFSEEPGMLTWNCQMDGSCKNGFMLQHRPVLSSDIDSYYSYAIFEPGKGRIKETNGGSGNISKMGQSVILKFKYDSANGLIITANGVQITRGEERSTDFKDLRAIADQYSGQMYLGFTSHCQSIKGDRTIKATVMFINGQKVSSIQTNTAPTLPPGGTTTTAATSNTTTGGKTTTTAAGTKTSDASDTSGASEPDTSDTEPEGTTGESENETTSRTTARGSSTTTDSIGTGGDDNTDNTTLIIVLVAVAVVVAGGGAGAFFLLRKQLPAGSQPPPPDPTE